LISVDVAGEALQLFSMGGSALFEGALGLFSGSYVLSPLHLSRSMNVALVGGNSQNGQPELARPTVSLGGIK
jgi:hypothetical protein